MERYIKVEWPDTQYFEGVPEYEDECYECYHGNEPTIFVPEELYNRVMK